MKHNVVENSGQVFDLDVLLPYMTNSHVPECWCVMSWQVEVGLKIVTSSCIKILCLFNLRGTLKG